MTEKQANGDPAIIRRTTHAWGVFRPEGWCVTAVEASYESARDWAIRNGFKVAGESADLFQTGLASASE